MGQTRSTCARIGIARVDDQCTDARSGLKVLAAHLHRRSAKTVLCEDPGHAGARIEQQNAQVLAVGFAHTGFGDAPTHTGDRMQLGGIKGRRVHGHGGLSADVG